MAEYTPDEEDVRADYAIGGARDTIGDIDYSAIPELGAEFDRFLARVKRDAWDEGVEAFEVAHKLDNIEPWAHLRDNPYEETP